MVDVRAQLDRASARLQAYLRDLEALVRIESPSGDLVALGRAADWLEHAFNPVANVTRADGAGGPVLRAHAQGRGDARVVVLAHYDTVHPVGSWPVPWRVEGDRAFGPGTADMKGGVLFALHALHMLAPDQRPTLDVVLTPDEEVDSGTGRPAIEAVARGADAVLVLEAPTNDGDPKVARKGVGHYHLTVHGKAAHQGVEPEKGVNAVVEAAHQVLSLEGIGDAGRGTVLGANVIHGGTRVNVVAARVEVEIDVRAWTKAEGERVDQALRSLRPRHPGARLELQGGFARPPMEASAATMALFDRLRRFGDELGLSLNPGRVGGGSDGNFTAAMGVPTLDGLGPVGFEDHQATEHILVSRVAERLALFTALLADLA